MDNKKKSIKAFERGCGGIRVFGENSCVSRGNAQFLPKIFPPLILLLLLLIVMPACGGGVAEDEAVGIVRGLVEASLPLNEIYFGEGMPVVEEGYGAYRQVTDDAPYLTEAALREATSAVYTSGYAEYLFSMFLTGYSDDDVGGVVFARYIENGDRLSMRVTGDVDVFPAREYVYDSIVITRTTKNTVDAEITSTDGTVVRVRARLEESGWRLDSPTY